MLNKIKYLYLNFFRKYRFTPLFRRNDYYKNLPDHFTLHRLSKLYIDKNLIFIHIPKNGGTSISNNIYGNNITLGHFKAHMIREFLGKKRFKNTEKFAIIREPISKFLSAYNWLLVSDFNADIKFRNEILNNYKNVSEFISDLKNLKKKGLLAVHFLPQHEFVTDGFDRLIVKKLINFDHLKKFEKYISNFSEHPVVPYLNKNNKYTITYKDLSKNDIDYLQKFYKKDFKIMDSMFNEPNADFNNLN